MPDGNGIDIIKSLKENINDSKIVVITVYSEPHIKDLCMSFGISLFITKPMTYINAKELFSSLSQ